MQTNSLIYTDDLETNFRNTTEFSYLKNAWSNLQIQLNNKVGSSNLSNYDTSTTVNSKISTVNDSINFRVSETTLNSTLWNYLGFD